MPPSILLPPDQQCNQTKSLGLPRGFLTSIILDSYIKSFEKKTEESTTDTMQFLQLSTLPLLAGMATATASNSSHDLVQRIITNAARDSIDLTVLSFHREALDSIAALRKDASSIAIPDLTTATKIDTHTHPIPSWFRTLELSAAGRETPTWNVSSHLTFMAERGIKRSILSVSTPQANAFASPSKLELDVELRKKKTVALARLLNEYVAEVCRVWPERFSWLGVTALPHVAESVREVEHALGLGACGVSVLTNAEGVYPGDISFAPLWEFLQARAETRDGREVVFIHPTDPVIALEDGRLISSRPCTYRCSPRSSSSVRAPSSPSSRTTCVRICRQAAHTGSIRKSTNSQSTPALRSRRVLLRNRARPFLPHRLLNTLHYHPPKVPFSPLAHITRRWRLSRHQRALPTRLLWHLYCCP